MKKNFVRVMLFGALTLAVSTTVTSCKDNDDDIKNLQEQIDKITSASPVSTEDMNAAVNAASKELKDQLAKLEKLVNDPSSEASLTQQIADLKKALETAVGKDAKDLAAKLASAQGDLNTLKEELNGKGNIKGLKQKIADLESVQATMQKLIDAEAAYNKDKTDLSGYANTGFGAFVSQEILDAIKEEGKIAEYVDNAVKTGVGSVLKDVNEYLSENFKANADLAAFVKEINETLFSDEYKARMDKLNNFLAAIDNAVAKGSDYKSYADVIDQIDATKKQLAALQLPSGKDVTFDSAVKDIVEDKLGAVNTSITNLATRLDAEIKAIKGMIQSVVYVPKNVAGTEEFTTLYAKKNAAATSYSIISRSEDLNVTFRVSPAEAALGFETGKYSLLMDAQKTRSTNTDIFTVGEVKVEKEGGKPTGLITVPLKTTSASQNFVLCLMVKDNSEKVLTEVTSNYFPVLMTTQYLSSGYKVKYVSGETGREIIYNDNASKLEFNKEGKVQAVFYDTEAAADVDASSTFVDIPAGLKGVFTTTFELTGDNKSYFSIDKTTGKVTLASTAFGQVGLVGQIVGVTAKTAISGVEKPVSTDLTADGQVTIAQKTENKEVAYTFDGDWKGNSEVSYIIPMVDLYNKGAITEADYKALQTAAFDVTSGADNGVTFARGNDNALTITVPSATKVGTYSPKAVIKVSSVKTITVKATVAVKSLADVALTTVASPQKVDAGVDAAQAGAIAVEVGDVSTLFPNYATVNAKVRAAGGTITFAKTGTGVNLVGNKLTITKDYKAPVKVTATVKCGEKKDAVYTVILTSDPKLSGTWTAPTELARTIASDKASTIDDLAKGSVWKDYRGEDMWKEGSVVTGDGTNGFANTVNALSVYGLDAPTFELTGDNADKFVVTAAGKLSYSDLGKNMPSRAGLTATVKVTVKSKWGGAISSTGDVTTITVTVK